jgi:threonylcarbamoyladenosine tRNA methylthiotransferase MtaB
VLRDLAARKNLEFRRSMIGRTVSAVTLGSGALAENYLKVKLATAREANRIIDVKIDGLTSDGLFESGTLPVLT